MKKFFYSSFSIGLLFFLFIFFALLAFFCFVFFSSFMLWCYQVFFDFFCSSVFVKQLLVSGKGTQSRSLKIVYLNNLHCLKSVRIRSYSGLYFPAFGLNTDRYRVSFRILSDWGKIQTRIKPNTDTFHAVLAKLTNMSWSPFLVKL